MKTSSVQLGPALLLQFVTGADWSLPNDGLVKCRGFIKDPFGGLKVGAPMKN